MSIQMKTLRHDGGSIDVEVETSANDVVIRFGSSFTIRLDETNVNLFRAMVHDAARDITIKRLVSSSAPRQDVTSVEVEEIED